MSVSCCILEFDYCNADCTRCMLRGSIQIKGLTRVIRFDAFAQQLMFPRQACNDLLRAELCV